MKKILAILMSLCVSAILLVSASPASASWSCDNRSRTAKWLEYLSGNLEARVRMNYTYCKDTYGFQWYYYVYNFKMIIERSGGRTYGCTDADRYKINVSRIGSIDIGPETWRCRDNDPYYKRRVAVDQRIYPSAYSNDKCFDFTFREVLFNQNDRVHNSNSKCI